MIAYDHNDGAGRSRGLILCRVHPGQGGVIAPSLETGRHCRGQRWVLITSGRRGELSVVTTPCLHCTGPVLCTVRCTVRALPPGGYRRSALTRTTIFINCHRGITTLTTLPVQCFFLYNILLVIVVSQEWIFSWEKFFCVVSIPITTKLYKENVTINHEFLWLP